MPKAPIECPEHTRLVGVAPPQDNTVACVNEVGIKQGPFIIWHPNGKTHKKGFHQDGQVQGGYAEWYEDGRPKAHGRFERGKMMGTWTRWYPSGGKKEEGAWDGETPLGPWRFWRENGQLSAEGSYHEGQKDCGWTEYAANGKKKVFYPKGRGCLDDFPSAIGISSMFISPEKETTNSISVEFSYTPRLRLNRQFLLQGKGSLIPFPESQRNSLQLIMNYTAMFLYHPSWARRFGVALGAGGVTWTGHGTGPQGEIAMYFNKLVTVGYSAWLLPGYFTHAARLGFELHI